ncbi:unnamed protein product [Moneuplotes crassus]|uniref:Uncharacterized protein n=1 Tax=Euplotes crassus TaxID=5936 RepID=A0AAD1U8L2_EUPCR|nr:unnamed protein product [Moneuplotes crassus]
MKDIIDAFDCPLKPIFTPSKKADAGTQYKIDHSPVIFRTVKQRRMSVNSKPVRKKSRNQSKRDRIKSMLEEKTRYLNVKYMTKNKMNLRGKNKPSNNKKGSKVKTNLDLKLSSPSINFYPKKSGMGCDLSTKEFGTVRFLNVKIKKNTKKSSDNAINQKSNHFTNNIPLKMNPSESGIHASLLSIQNQNSNFKVQYKF